MIQLKKQLKTLAVAAILVAAFVLLRYLPQHRKLAETKSEISCRTNVISQAGILQNKLDELTSQTSDLKNQVADFKTKIPENRDLGIFLRQIANLMDAHNLSDQVVEPALENAADKVKYIPVSMKCSGTLNNIFGFFAALKNNGRLVRISKVTLQNTKDMSGTLEMKSQAYIYYRPSPEPQG
jgi:Tfp pilus assembly protein PilO